MGDYEKLLDRAYEAVPKQSSKGERFELPRAEVMPQGSKTVVKNFEAIANTLRRPAKDLMKYMQKELAVPTTKEGSRLVLHGKFNARVVNEKLKNFYEIFVRCKECKKPDTNIITEEHGVKMLVCEACGARSPVRG
ncbi:translation initiation factor IF-2 subunit beta [Candidatus Micrarchaeota archaeon]|nr:MAG: translation initiation factor IF-2 subunit beta [Candidatus Micrarchaeota archaeon]